MGKRKQHEKANPKNGEKLSTIVKEFDREKKDRKQIEKKNRKEKREDSTQCRDGEHAF